MYDVKIDEFLYTNFSMGFEQIIPRHVFLLYIIFLYLFILTHQFINTIIFFCRLLSFFLSEYATRFMHTSTFVLFQNFYKLKNIWVQRVEVVIILLSFERKNSHT